MLTPDVSHTVGGVLLELSTAEGELGLAFLWGRWVLGQELHDVGVFFITPRAAATDDVHDARQYVTGSAAKTASPNRRNPVLFLT